MRTFALAAAATAAAAVVVPGPASALPGGVLTYCNASVQAATPASGRLVAVVASAYSIDSGVVATSVRCTVRSGSTVWGSTQSAAPGPATVAVGTASVPDRATGEVCVSGSVTYADGSTLSSAETCNPLPDSTV